MISGWSKTSTETGVIPTLLHVGTRLQKSVVNISIPPVTPSRQKTVGRGCQQGVPIYRSGVLIRFNRLWLGTQLLKTICRSFWTSFVRV